MTPRKSNNNPHGIFPAPNMANGKRGTTLRPEPDIYFAISSHGSGYSLHGLLTCEGIAA